MLVARLIAERLARTVARRPVTVVVGPRQAGKTTLVRAALPDATYVPLDSFAQRASAQTDPEGFLRRLTRPLIIDEAQRVPELLIAVKQLVDEDRRPGSFCLTGSADVFANASVAESLAGRASYLQLLPLAERELAGGSGSFVDDLLAAVDNARTAPALTHVDLLARTLRGGFPELWADRSIDATAFYRSYVATYLERDLQGDAKFVAMTR